MALPWERAVGLKGEGQEVLLKLAQQEPAQRQGARVVKWLAYPGVP